MAKSPSKHYHSPVWAWKIDRARLYAKLAALGGMEDRTKIKPDFAWQGKLMLPIGSDMRYAADLFEVRVWMSNPARGPYSGRHQPHRISVRCPKCHAWTPFGRLHQHILSQRCLATAEIASRLPAIHSLRSEAQ